MILSRLLPCRCRGYTSSYSLPLPLALSHGTMQAYTPDSTFIISVTFLASRPINAVASVLLLVQHILVADEDTLPQHPAFRRFRLAWVYTKYIYCMPGIYISSSFLLCHDPLPPPPSVSSALLYFAPYSLIIGVYFLA